MSLLSEAVSTVVQSPNSIQHSFLVPPTLPGYVTVATAVYDVIEPQLKDTVVEIPLNVLIPSNAVVLNVIIDTPVGFVSPGVVPATLGVGVVTLNDVYSDVITNWPWVTDSYYLNVYFNPFLVPDATATVKFQVTDASIVTGKTFVKVLFV